LILSDRVNEEFKTPKGNRLAFQIHATAQGLYSDKSGDWNNLPEDIQLHIISEIFCMETTPSIVRGKISRDMHKNVSKWLKANPVSLKQLGCENVIEGIRCVKENNLDWADFSGFPDFFSGFPTFNDENLKKLIHDCPNLKSLNLSGCSRFSEENLSEGLKMLPNLQNLNLNGCRITGEKLFEAAKTLGMLQSLDLSGCFNISEENLFKTLEVLPNLQNLDLCGCNISYEKLFEFLKMLPNLQCLYLSGCEMISEEKIFEVSKIHPNQNLRFIWKFPKF
jgi:hypothetical protein